MYRIIGTDGHEYGPVSADQLRQWIAEGRANAHTKAAAEGSTDWKPLGSHPEFSLLFATTPPTAAPPAYILNAPVRKTNPMAMTGMILGIVSLTFGLCCCYGIPLNVLGLIFSLVGLSQIRSNPELHDGKGIAIAGVVLCVLSILLAIACFAIFGAMSFLEELRKAGHSL